LQIPILLPCFCLPGYGPFGFFFLFFPTKAAKKGSVPFLESSLNPSDPDPGKKKKKPENFSKTTDCKFEKKKKKKRPKEPHLNRR